MSNITFTIPPFPSQDLAKLVLGYLAEEQLMTAYDEFLQASPYLDALQNEYDRIFMTSLKNILAEYRAVKIYVETCKPFVLRRKLFQFSNLLEIVKFLVNNVDINKLHSQDGNSEKVGFSRHSLSKSYACSVCQSLKLSSCTCRSNQSTSQIEATSLEDSVETTSLADLPGNTSYRKKCIKETDPINNSNCLANSITSSNQAVDGRYAKLSINLSNMTFGSDAPDNVISSGTEKKCPQSPSLLVKEHPPELRHTVQGVNDVQNLVSHNRIDNAYNKLDDNDARNISMLVDTDKLPKFAIGDSSNSKTIVPDSSTSENIVIQSSTTEADNVINSMNVSKSSIRPPPLLIKIGNEHKHMSSPQNTLHALPRIAPKSSLVKSTNRIGEDQVSPKITILSDIKVDDAKIPTILKGANPSSLVPMQTLFINGTQAYKDQPQVDQRYTKDEIMAMPTIILVPATDKSKKIVPTVTQENVLNTESTVSCSTSRSLGPLVIDVSSNDDTSFEMNTKNDVIQSVEKQSNDNLLIKTVDMPVNHASLPKDNTVPGLKISTPHVVPPTRKSSSTPRRSSHVRVLDFATPRRILHETLNERQANHCPPSDVPVPIDSSLPAINKNSEDTVNKVNNVVNPDKSNDPHSGAKKEKTSIKLYNWDSDLRALAYVGNGNIEKTEPRRKRKKSKKKESLTNKCTTTPTSSEHNTSEDSKTNKSNSKKKLTPKIEGTKSIKQSIDADKSIEKQEPTTSVVKPNINIISQQKWPEPVQTEKIQNKSPKADGTIDTPELEKMSLQNEIGVKLNISDLLETPYKQALYDIQMDTPKFLGPDIPDLPLSDIKIMNIPTPRFLNTPKLVQNTPSSYSSRPTDYSSGGSYYKPDDQDYELGNGITADDLPLSAISSKLNKESKSAETPDVNVEKVSEGKLRPVRQCTKNVSYNYYGKAKEVEEKTEKCSTCSDSSINKPDKKIEKIKIIKCNKDNVGVKQKETKRRNKKYKSPMKKEIPKTFMKIKPRRTTPVKEILGKGRKKNSDLSPVVYIKSLPKKVINEKETNDCSSPLVVPLLTKSRRKSSTPRKLHCTKRFVSESSVNISPEEKKDKLPPITTTICIQDSDSEQQALLWSDDGSQELKAKTTEEIVHITNESDDISKIKEYISKTIPNEMASRKECEGNLQVDLIKRGFDIETARIIERDLLETSTDNLVRQDVPMQSTLQSMPSPILNEKDNGSKSKTSDRNTESDCSISNNLQIVQDEDDDEFEFSVQECNEDTNNYFAYNFDETKFTASNQIKLKETFSMEICIENDVTIRLRAMPFNTGFEHDSRPDDPDTCNKSIDEKSANPSYYDLYTPRKAQCYQLFDSTLASLDNTPLKPKSPKERELETVAEIVLEVEKLETDVKLKPETKKRKRIQCGTSDESSNGSKKVKPDTSYLLNSAGIQNIDIESVLSKLHGP